MNKYYLPLNIIRDSVFKSEWSRPSKGLNTEIPSYRNLLVKDGSYAKEIFTTEFYEKLRSISEISLIFIFIHKNNYDSQMAHIDILRGPDNKITYIHSGLNIVFDDSTDVSGTMRWYSLKDNTNITKIEYAAAVAPYLSYQIDELNLEEEYCISDFVTLVRTDVPHTTISGNDYRTCISVRFKDNFDWDTVVKKFDNTFNQ
jgi:hypothetical protein